GEIVGTHRLPRVTPGGRAIPARYGIRVVGRDEFNVSLPHATRPKHVVALDCDFGVRIQRQPLAQRRITQLVKRKDGHTDTRKHDDDQQQTAAITTKPNSVSALHTFFPYGGLIMKASGYSVCLSLPADRSGLQNLLQTVHADTVVFG